MDNDEAQPIECRAAVEISPTNRQLWYLKNRNREIARVKARFAADPERYKAYQKNYRETHREQIRQKTREDRHKIHNRRLKRQYGITLSQWRKIFESQGGKCAICSTSKFDSHGPHTDHCKLAGHVRGILCHNCNTAIGLLKHDINRLCQAIKYLSREVLFNQGSENE